MVQVGRERDAFGVEQARSFAGILEADAARRPAGIGDHAAAQEALEVDGQIEVVLAQFRQEAEDLMPMVNTSPALPAKRDDLVDAGVERDKAGEGIVDTPADQCLGIVLADQVHSGQRVHDVAKAAGFDDKDVHRDTPTLQTENRTRGPACPRICTAGGSGPRRVDAPAVRAGRPR